MNILQQQQQDDDPLEALQSLIVCTGFGLSGWDEDACLYFDLQSLLARSLLVSSDGVLENAFKYFTDYISVRQKYIPNIIEIPPVSDIQTKAFWSGHDKTGYPCMIVKIKNVTQAMSVQQKMYFMFYMMDESVRMMKLRGTNKIVVIWDREGYVKEQNYDQHFFDEMKPHIDTFGNYATESIKMIYVTHINWFFRAMFEVGKSVSNNKVFKKVSLVDDPKKLIKYFDAPQLKQMGYLRP